MSIRENSRQRILAAASRLVRTEGSAHLSLDAVAALAGLSKGGLLYHFPNKTALLTALVEQYVEKSSAPWGEQLERDEGQLVSLEYFKLVADEISSGSPSPAGVLAALSENPDLLAPIKNFNRQLLDRVAQGAGDNIKTLVAVLALEGMRAQRLFGVDAFSPEERELVLERIKQMLNDA
jgi:AcrR family transcriptional regulator